MQQRDKLGEVFQGVTTKPDRDYLFGAFKELVERYPVIHMPACGRLSCTEVAVAAGYEPQNIHASDISLFSTLVGFVMAGRDVKDLGVKFHTEELKPLQRRVRGQTGAGVVLYAQKLCQIGDKAYYERIVRDELVENKDEYIRQFNERLAKLKERLGGLTYTIEDMWDHLARAAVDPNALIYVNPPAYKGGYSKMYETDGRITWDEPKIAEFDPNKQHDRMYEEMNQAKAFAIMGRVLLPPDHPMQNQCVWSNEISAKRKDYLMANRPEELSRGIKRRNETEIRPAKVPILPLDHEVTDETTIHFIETDKQRALYYRDLWAHKLGSTASEAYYFMLLDGYLFGVFGIIYRELMIGRFNRVSEVFGFNAPSRRHKRLNKLFMMLLVCEEARLFYSSELPASVKAVRDVEEFQTSCITQYPELKVNRGVGLRLVDRKKRPDGRFHLNYLGGFTDMMYRDVIAKWRGKDADA